MLLTIVLYYDMFNLQLTKKIGRYVNKGPRKGVPQNDAVWRGKRRVRPPFFMVQDNQISQTPSPTSSHTPHTSSCGLIHLTFQKPACNTIQYLFWKH